MYALTGLSPASAAALRAALPSCYSSEFDRDCIQEANPEGYRGCATVLQAYAEDPDGAEAIVDQLPFCSEGSMFREKLVFGAGGALLGALLGVLLS